jgi:surfactin synthase thioesterase subunit
MSGASLPLVLLPFAGGSSYSYRGLFPHLPPWVEPVTPELPGRGTRFRAPLRGTIEQIADDLLPGLRRPMEGPAGWALFGHSMGALLAFELARRALLAGSPHPRCLIASGRRPPHLPGDPPLHGLDRPLLLARLRELGGLPPEAEGSVELMDLVLPILRADLRADETYAPPGGPPLACPIVSLVGSEDRHVGVEAAARWGDLTTGACRVEALPGGHFFVQDAPAAVGAAIARALTVPSG